MKRLILLTALGVLLAGCAPRTASVPPAESAQSAGNAQTSGISQPSESETQIPSATGSYPAPDLTGLPPLDSAAELEDLSPADFGVMEEAYETETGSYPLLEGTELENTVYILRGQEEGPVLYVVGGVHGDELAGWYAGTVLRRTSLKAGTVYVLAPANRYGAEHDQRRTEDDRDLNRNFPGDPEGCGAERIAAAIFDDIADKRPDFVLDLHEAILHDGDGLDNLGNSIICGDIQKVDELIFALLLDSREGKLTTRPLDIFSSPPAGSLNAEVTDRLGIPVVTAETYREEPLTARVLGQLRLAEYVFNWYGLR